MNRKANVSNDSSKRQKLKTFTEVHGEAEHVQALKHNATNIEEIVSHWTASAATRMNSIGKMENNLKQIFDVWPQFKLPDGFRLV